MLSPVTIPTFKLKPLIWTSLVFCLLYLCYLDRINWYYEFSKSEQDYAQTAIADCRFHLRLAPNDWKLHRDLGHFLEKEAVVTFDGPKRQALFQEAIREYRYAIRRNPIDADMYCDLGDIYDGYLDDHRTANAYYKKCVGLAPADSMYRNRLECNEHDLKQEKDR